MTGTNEMTAILVESLHVLEEAPVGQPLNADEAFAMRSLDALRAQVHWVYPMNRGVRVRVSLGYIETPCEGVQTFICRSADGVERIYSGPVLEGREELEALQRAFVFNPAPVGADAAVGCSARDLVFCLLRQAQVPYREVRNGVEYDPCAVQTAHLRQMSGGWWTATLTFSDGSVRELTPPSDSWWRQEELGWARPNLTGALKEAFPLASVRIAQHGWLTRRRAARHRPQISNSAFAECGPEDYDWD